MYRRSTRESTLDELAPPVRAALTKHAEANQLVLGAGTRVWVTHSENPPAEGFFGKLFSSRANSADPDVAHDTIIVLHTSHLVFVTSGEKRGTSALSIPIAQASLARGNAVAAKLGVTGTDDGVTITGFPGQHGQHGSYFVGLGTDAAGAACAEALEGAIVASKNA